MATYKSYAGFPLIAKGYSKLRKESGHSGWRIVYKEYNRYITLDFDSKEQYKYTVETLCSTREPILL